MASSARLFGSDQPLNGVIRANRTPQMPRTATTRPPSLPARLKQGQQSGSRTASPSQSGSLPAAVRLAEAG